MRKAVLWKAFLGIMTILAVAGCATMSNKAPVNEKAAVKKVMEQWKHAIETKNLDEAMATISDDSFSNAELGGKTDVMRYLNNSFAEGGLDNAKISFANAQFTVEDQKATVFPVQMKAKTDEAAFSFQLRRENGKWFIVNMEQTSPK